MIRHDLFDEPFHHMLLLFVIWHTYDDMQHIHITTRPTNYCQMMLTSRSYQFEASNSGVLDGSGVSSSVYVLTRIRWLYLSESKLYIT